MNIARSEIAPAPLEREANVDGFVVEYLGHLAILTLSPGDTEKAQSHMYEDLNVSAEEVVAAIEIVEQAKEAPGVKAAMGRLEVVSQRATAPGERRVALETIAHERRVAIFATIAARRVGLIEEQIEAMAIAGLIHDR